MGRRTDTPIVSIVGKSDSGKTTLLEALIGELSSRGWQVATVKHHVHDFDIDIPGKDSWRHARAGAVVSMVSSPERLGVMRQVAHERTLDELAAEVTDDADILLTEGYKRAGRVRIEVSRNARSRELVCEAEELFALVTDGERDASGVATFGLDEIARLTDLVEDSFLSDGRSRAGR